VKSVGTRFRPTPVKRQSDEALVNEHQSGLQDQISNAKNQAADAAAGQVKREDAQTKAELAKGLSDTERAALALATSANASSADA